VFVTEKNSARRGCDALNHLFRQKPVTPRKANDVYWYAPAMLQVERQQHHFSPIIAAQEDIISYITPVIDVQYFRQLKKLL